MSNRQMVISLLLGIIILPLISNSENNDSLYLSSLHEDCVVQKEWFGLVPVFREALFLKCKGVSFLITNPKNLVGHVSIITTKQALEYVRFFTSADSYKFFELRGAVELFPGKVHEHSEFNILDAKVFYQHFKEAKVQQILGTEGKKEFVVTRTIVSLDQKIYEINEFVREDGFYDVSTTTIVYKDALKLGIIHVGDI